MRAEVEIIQWFVKVGDQIKAFDRVCEVQSDKATVEISSRYDGEVVRVYADVGGIANGAYIHCEFCVCVCVCERERARERESVCVCILSYIGRRSAGAPEALLGFRV